MLTASKRLIFNWIVGVIVGTLMIAVTSPLFVRSYVPLRVDPVRGVWTMPPGSVYRWRSEGYANTAIGPLGMPGKRSAADDDAAPIRVALWGDSQAEGVCVADDLKIHRQAERRAKNELSVFPLARSGEDAAVWITQMPAVEKALAIDVHVMLIVDLPDLLTAPLAPIAPPGADAAKQADAAIAGRLPAFVIQGARNLLTEADENGPRKLRFSVGPVEPEKQRSIEAAPDDVDWSAAMDAIGEGTDRPVVILFAPIAPQIVAGNVVTDIASPQDFRAMQSAAEAAGLVVVDLRESLLESMRSGNWPHGFQNGYVGSGHLNSHGNRLVAQALIDAVQPLGAQVD